MPNIIYDVALGTSAAELQAMVDGAEGGSAFRLQAGTYAFDAPIQIGTSDVSIFGAGSGQTIIQVEGDLNGAPVFQVGHNLHSPIVEQVLQLGAPALAGSNQIVVQADHELVAGDFVYLTQDNTDDWLDAIGDQDWRQTKDLRTVAAKVAAVEGQVVTLDRNLTFDFDPLITQVEQRTYLTGNELSGFTIIGAYGVSDPSNFSNTIAEGQGQSMILFAGTSDAVAFDIRIHEAPSHGLTVADSLDIHVKDLTVDGAHNKGSGGNGYALWIRDSQNGTFDDLVLADTRHGVTFASYTSATGNFVHVLQTNRDVNFHGGRDQFNTVIVDQMLRVGPEQDYLSAATYFNQGETWGAPTDSAQNEIYFRELVASNLDDTVVSHADGSNLSLLNGDDTAVTWTGDDFVFAGAGDDTVFASAGRDYLDGGADSDTLVFAHDFADVAVQVNGAELVFSAPDGGITTALEFELFRFNDGISDYDQLISGSAPTPSAPLQMPDDLPALGAPTPGYKVAPLDNAQLGAEADPSDLSTPLATYFKIADRIIDTPDPAIAPDPAPVAPAPIVVPAPTPVAPTPVVPDPAPTPPAPVVPISGPDLTIADAWLDDSVLAPGDSTKMRLVVQNLGDEDVKGESTFYWSADDTFDTTDVAFGMDSHSTVSAGEVDSNERLSIDYDDLALYGDGYLFAVIDAYDIVPEANETNNVSDAVFIDIL